MPSQKRREDDLASYHKRKIAGGDDFLENRRSIDLQSKYGITTDDKYTMWCKQDQSCAICGDSIPNFRKAHVDHNHLTGKVRGLLCAGCNRGLYYVEDKLLHELILAYLERHED